MLTLRVKARGTVNKAISLALLVGALLAALAFTPAAWKLARQPAQDESGAVPYVVTSWKPAPERAQHVKSGAVPSVDEEANAGRAIESAGPPADSQIAPPAATTIMLPARPIRQEAKGEPRSLTESESRKSAATPLQFVFTKSYVTPSNPEPEAADVAALPADAPRRAKAAPRPRRYSTRPRGVSSSLFGIFSW
jgi:hypothetical protein